MTENKRTAASLINRRGLHWYLTYNRRQIGIYLLLMSSKYYIGN